MKKYFVVFCILIFYGCTSEIGHKNSNSKADSIQNSSKSQSKLQIKADSIFLDSTRKSKKKSGANFKQTVVQIEEEPMPLPPVDPPRIDTAERRRYFKMSRKQQQHYLDSLRHLRGVGGPGPRHE